MQDIFKMFIPDHILATASSFINTLVCPSACPSLCGHISSPIIMTFCHIIGNAHPLWLPSFQGHMSNFKVTQAKKLMEQVKFVDSGHFQKNAWKKWPAYISWPELIRSWSQSIYFPNFDAFLTWWNGSNLYVCPSVPAFVSMFLHRLLYFATL